MVLVPFRFSNERLTTTLGAAGRKDRGVENRSRPQLGGPAWFSGSSKTEALDDSDLVSSAFWLRSRAQRKAAHLTGHAMRVAPRVRPNTVPPPFIDGSRIEPCRARPVPFWR